MTDKPIIFSGPMVRAILEGRKTQTRRVLKYDPMDFASHAPTQKIVDYYGDGRVGMVWERDGRSDLILPLQYSHGDRLWVRETWRPSISAIDPWHVAVLYPHDGRVKHWNWASDADFGDWTIPKAAAKGNVSPLFMPRWSSRLTLVVTDVRVQRVQEISEADAVAEGSFLGHCQCMPKQNSGDKINRMFNQTWCHKHGDSFRTLWDSLNAKRGYDWDANPWVAAYTFTVHHCNIDQMEAA